MGPRASPPPSPLGDRPADTFAEGDWVRLRVAIDGVGPAGAAGRIDAPPRHGPRPGAVCVLVDWQNGLI